MEWVEENVGFFITTMTSLLLIGTSLIFNVYRPKKINYFIGYRTPSSAKSQERWDFAQAFWPGKMIKVAILLLLMGGVFFLVDLDEGTEITSAVILVLIASFYPIIETERALKRKFD